MPMAWTIYLTGFLSPHYSQLPILGVFLCSLVGVWLFVKVFVLLLYVWCLEVTFMDEMASWSRYDFDPAYSTSWYSGINFEVVRVGWREGPSKCPCCWWAATGFSSFCYPWGSVLVTGFSSAMSSGGSPWTYTSLSTFSEPPPFDSYYYSVLVFWHRHSLQPPYPSRPSFLPTSPLLPPHTLLYTKSYSYWPFAQILLTTWHSDLVVLMAINSLESKWWCLFWDSSVGYIPGCQDLITELSIKYIGAAIFGATFRA